MMHRTEVKRVLGALVIAAFFFGGFSIIAAEKVLVGQPKTTLQIQGQDKPNSPSKDSKDNWTSPGNLQSKK